MSRLLRMLLASLIWTGFAALAGYLFTALQTVVVCAGVGALLGSLVGGRLAESRLRLPALYVITLLIWLLTLSLVGALRFFDFPSHAWDPSHIYLLSAGLRWGMQSLLLALVLRATSVRRPSMVLLEVCLMAAVLARLFLGHRDGHINRPFFLVDPLWSQGYDPLPVFMAIGAGLAALAVILANSGARRQGAFRDSVVAIALVAAFFVFAPVRTLSDLPRPPQLKNEHGDTASDLEQRYAENDRPDFDDRKRGEQNSPVAVVLFDDDYTPGSEIYLFRQRAYSLYDGKMLVADPSENYDADLPRQFPVEPITPKVDPVQNLEQQQVGTLLCLISDMSRPLGLANAHEFTAAANPDPTRFRTAYRVDSSCFVDEPIMQVLERQPGSSQWDKATWDHYLKIPEDPRYKELADEIAADGPEKYRGNAIVAAILTKLWMDKNIIYSLKTQHARADDPVADFLFGDRTGYCVYIAHAACHLYRAQGVPARVVGGFAVPSENRGTGSALLLGGRYAHAWPEIYVEGAGWLPLDVTPERSVEEPIAPPEESLQQLLGEIARKKVDPLVGHAKPAINLQQRAREGLLMTLAALPWIALTALLILWIGKLWHHWQACHASPERLPVSAYRGVLQRLAEVGLVRLTGETREQFAQRVGDQRCPGLRRLTLLHLEHALGHGRLANPEELRSLYRQSAQDLAQQLPPVRRVLTALDPISWLKGR
jgi:transglutaminase-like putative cysteine protease